MARSAVELDFFRLEKERSPKPPPQKKLFDRRRSFRDIQGVISKLNPELLKTVIASGSVDRTSGIPKSSSFSVPSTPKHDENPFAALPVYVPSFGSSEITPDSAPMTIFYNGAVAVFDVPRYKAENILKFAEGGVSKTDESADPDSQLLETLNGDLPIARRKSLQTFLLKRKERLTLVSPYGDYAFSRKKTSGDRE